MLELYNHKLLLGISYSIQGRSVALDNAVAHKGSGELRAEDSWPILVSLFLPDFWHRHRLTAFLNY